MKAFKVTVRVLLLLYPLFVFLLIRGSYQSLAVLLAFVCLALQVNWKNKKLCALQLIGIGFLASILWFYKPENFVRICPFIISLSFLGIFFNSLSKDKSIIEEYTSVFKRVSKEESLYLRSLTKVWIGFLAINSLILGALIFWGSLESWFFYSNIIFYILLGTFIGASIIYGRWKLKKKRSPVTQAILVSLGFSFFIFFSALYSLLVPFVCVLLLGQKKYIQPTSKWIVRHFFRVFLSFLYLVRLLHVKVVDHRASTDRAPQIIVATHVCMFDVLIVLAHFPKCTTFVKSKFSNNPLLKLITWSSGFISVDGADAGMNQTVIDRATSALNAGESFVIFPEGTRSENGQLGPFKAGSFHLALTSGCSITPLLFTSTSAFFTGKNSVFARQDGMVRVEAHIFPSQKVEKIEDQSFRRQMSRNLSESLRNYFLEKQKDYAFDWNKPKRIVNYLGASVELVNITNEKIEAKFRVPPGHPHFDGHFVRFPILPAISQIQMIEEILSSVLNKTIEIHSLKRSKFTNLIQPEMPLECHLTLVSESEADWVFLDAEKTYSKGRFSYEYRN